MLPDLRPCPQNRRRDGVLLRMVGVVVLVAGVLVTGLVGTSSAATYSLTTTGAWVPVTNDPTYALCTGSACPGLSTGPYRGSEIRWGAGATSIAAKSGLGFVPVLQVPLASGQQVALGEFDVFNLPVTASGSTTIDSRGLPTRTINLNVGVRLTDGTTTFSGNLPVRVQYHETPNTGTAAQCPFPSVTACSDEVEYTFLPFTATSGNQLATVSVTGFSTSSSNSAALTPNAVVEEERQTSLYLFASFTIGHPPVANAGDDRTVEQVGALTSVTLDGSASADPDAGDHLTYTWTWTAGGVQQTATGEQPVVHLPAGATPITLSVSDGTFTSTDTTTVTVQDTSPPTITGSAQGPSNGTWFNGPVTVTWTCADTGSGIAATGCPDPTTVTGEGAGQDVSGTATDNAGLTATATVTVSIDSTPPVTTLQGVPGGWSATAVQLSVTSLDPLSGVADTEYAVDGGPAQPVGPGGTFTVSGDGAHTVRYWSVDVAGNSETPHEATVQIDGTAPTITHTLDPASANGWNRGTTTVTFQCADTGGSGVASCSDPVTVTTEGHTSVPGTAVDNAGNRNTDTADVAIDGTGPVVTTNRSAAANAAGWYRTPVTVSFTCSDPALADGSAGSGVAACPDPVPLTGDGVGQSVQVVASDTAGNTTAATDGGINIDRAAPTITGAVSSVPNGAGWYHAPVTVHWTCSDALSGLANPGGCPADTVVSTNGANQTVTGTAVDKAGNTATATVGPLAIDTAAPTITFSGNAGTYTVDQTVHIGCAVTDALSGIATSTCPTVDVPAASLTPGATTLTATATDKAGNSGTATTTYTVLVDCAGLKWLTAAYSTNAGVTNGLEAKLDAACSAANANARAGQLNAYANQVRAQTGKALTADQAATLLRLVAKL